MNPLLFSDQLRVVSKKVAFLYTIAVKALKLVVRGRFKVHPHILAHSSQYNFINGYVAVYILCNNALWYRFPGQLVTSDGGLKLIPMSALRGGVLKVYVFGLFQRKIFEFRIETENLNLLNSNSFVTTLDKLSLNYNPRPPYKSFAPNVRVIASNVRTSLYPFGIRMPKITLNTTLYNQNDFL